ncbi:OB-fold-containig protein [Shewanella sp. YIC-542]|uniref:OB-fold-containig protein n=1 Tax=Shewanella mytili TaxID=3377111 RepID=UPI00398F7216
MLDFILANDNLPYVVGAAVVAMLGMIEMMARVAGGSLWMLMDEPLTVQQGDETASDTSSLTAWLALDRLPVLLWFILALVFFTLSGFSLNLVLWLSADIILPQSISVWPAFAMAAVSCHFAGRWFSWSSVMDDDSENLCGNIGILTLGKAIKGNPAEALVHDEWQRIHYVLVEPQEDNTAFEAGTRVLLLRREGMIWRAIRFEP